MWVCTVYIYVQTKLEIVIYSYGRLKSTVQNTITPFGAVPLVSHIFHCFRGKKQTIEIAECKQFDKVFLDLFPAMLSRRSRKNTYSTTWSMYYLP